MPPVQRRRLHRVAEEEDAAQLKLGILDLYSHFLTMAGDEFNDADTLTTSEARLLINVVLTQRPKETGEEVHMTEYHLPLVWR